jgi:outer membrane usher protein
MHPQQTHRQNSKDDASHVLVMAPRVLTQSQRNGQSQRNSASRGRPWRVSLFVSGLFVVCAIVLPRWAMAQSAQSGPNSLSPASSSAQDRSPSTLSVALLAVTLNGVPQRNTATALTNADYSVLYLAERALAEMRVGVPPNATTRTEDGERFVALSSLAGVTFRIDANEQRIFLTVKPTAFRSTSVALATQIDPTTTSAGMTGYLAYDLNAEWSSNTQRSIGGITELGIASPFGVLTNSHVFNRSTISGYSGARFGQSGSFTESHRLDTTLTIDRPAQTQSIRIGDFVSRGALWTQPSRVGGLQISTNFNTRPGFITYPLREVSGQAALPSVVDVFVNNLFAGRQEVAAGPFQVTNVPIVNGQGDVRVVVRDVLGREQVFTSSFYASSQLLAPGLNDYALSIGKARQQYGLQSFEYGRLQSSGYWRRGITTQWTLLANVEAARGFSSAGIGTTFVLPAFAELSASVAQSRISGRPETNENQACCIGVASDFARRVPSTGQFASLSIDRRFSSWSLGGQWRVASRGFRGLSDLDGIATRLASTLPRREVILSAGLGGGRSGSWSLNYISQTRDRVITDANDTNGSRITPDAPVAQIRLDSLALGYNVSLGKRGFLSIAAISTLPRTSNNIRNRNLQLTYVLPLGMNHSFTASHTRDELTTAETARRITRDENRATFQRALPTGEGYGYRIEASDDRLYRAETRLATSFATLGLDWAEANGSRGFRASANGTFTAIGGGVYAGRRVADGFALVDVGGFPNVRVYADNQLQGTTDKAGRLFLSNLRPFQRNLISIEPNDLPIAAEIAQMKLDATPVFKSGVVVRFPVRLARGALLRLVDASGMPIPSGALVQLAHVRDAAFPVADDGMVYLTDLQQVNQLRVTHAGRQCAITVNLPKNLLPDDPQPQLGNYTCKLDKQ